VAAYLNLIAVTTVFFALLLIKNIEGKDQLFSDYDSTFPQLYCLKFSLKSVHISKSYARKQKWVFFSEHNAEVAYTVSQKMSQV